MRALHFGHENIITEIDASFKHNLLKFNLNLGDKIYMISKSRSGINEQMARSHVVCTVAKWQDTYCQNVVHQLTTRRSENDNTPQPLDQWTNSPFMGQQVGNCKSFTLTHYLADLFAMHCDPRASPSWIRHCIQLASLLFQVDQPSHS